MSSLFYGLFSVTANNHQERMQIEISLVDHLTKLHFAFNPSLSSAAENPLTKAGVEIVKVPKGQNLVKSFTLIRRDEWYSDLATQASMLKVSAGMSENAGTDINPDDAPVASSFLGRFATHTGPQPSTARLSSGLYLRSI
ncbi:hypothetical protein CIHG_04777 [Coccidioides immitis H538.4]|uniref:Uncharacterized protein n=3 Tax=Coccidioides immitis TaxID=5501 RepID=A0A0J8RE08_COCIT|nr:hypothetical protein CIRG_08200 [Coccidioides immitis RMSCC 2394]KMU82103.1 hypothetical protein CISG_09633 [Coccidioides immitis RMSCC 3703]KMU87332.1 hypothetical protein CIHG_04777 [Coccidioides immitis H538.4]